MNASRIAACAVLCLLAALVSGHAHAQAAEDGSYKLNAGDVLVITVWKEPDLSREALVRPDGRITFPLVGDVMAAGNSPEQLQAAIVEKMQLYIPDASVNVSVAAVNGNKVYVLGKVARPGEYVVTRHLDVMQALALAGGLNSFANEDKIRILRRQPDGTQQALRFDYSDVSNGKRLETNITLMSGDLVIVP